MRHDARYRNSCTSNHLAIDHILHHGDDTQGGVVGVYFYSMTCDIQRYVLVLTILDILIMMVSVQPVKADAIKRVENRNAYAHIHYRLFFYSLLLLSHTLKLLPKRPPSYTFHRS